MLKIEIIQVRLSNKIEIGLSRKNAIPSAMVGHSESLMPEPHPRRHDTMESVFAHLSIRAAIYHGH